MSVVQKWTQKMDSYYENMDTNSLKVDLQRAGFEIAPLDANNSTEHILVLAEIESAMKEAAASDEFEDFERTTLLVDKSGYLVDVI
jgi:hypothetical protein